MKQDHSLEFQLTRISRSVCVLVGRVMQLVNKIADTILPKVTGQSGDTMIHTPKTKRPDPPKTGR